MNDQKPRSEKFERGLATRRAVLGRDMKPHVLSRSFGSGFSMALMAKDLRTAADLADEMGMPALGAERAAALWSAALASLGPDADHTEIFRYLENAAGGSGRAAAKEKRL